MSESTGNWQLSTSNLIRDYGPKTALAVAQVTGVEELAFDRLLDDLNPSSLRRSVASSLPDYEDPERFDGMS